MKQSRTAAPVSMSASCLPLLCPVVGKAPVLTLRPKQKLPTPSQQALFTLLKQRHERYRTQQESVAADSTAADDRGTRTMYPAAHSVRQFDIGSPYSPNGNLHRSQRTSAASLLSDLGKWYFEITALCMYIKIDLEAECELHVRLLISYPVRLLLYETPNIHTFISKNALIWLIVWFIVQK